MVAAVFPETVRTGSQACDLIGRSPQGSRKNNFTFCCRLSGPRASRYVIGPMSNTSTLKRSKYMGLGLRAASLRGAAAGRHLLRCRSSTMHSGIDCVAAPCICRPQLAPECEVILAWALRFFPEGIASVLLLETSRWHNAASCEASDGNAFSERLLPRGDFAFQFP